jgi:hypothetical protein
MNVTIVEKKIRIKLWDVTIIPAQANWYRVYLIDGKRLGLDRIIAWKIQVRGEACRPIPITIHGASPGIVKTPEGKYELFQDVTLDEKSVLEELQEREGLPTIARLEKEHVVADRELISDAEVSRRLRRLK